MTDVAEAEALILGCMQALPSEERLLGDTAGAVLRENVEAERDQPPFDRVTMDGIAIKFSDWDQGLRRYRVIGTQGAGAPPLLIHAGECVEIMTGAMLPDGADTVIPVERLTQDQSIALIEDSAKVSDRQFVHPRGSDRIAGTRLLSSGLAIGPTEMAILASAGLPHIQVTKSPKIAVLSTGDELVEVGAPIEPYQIRSSNDRAIEASLLRHTQARVTRVNLKDDPETMFETIARLHDANDTLILSGGVSMGQYDFVPRVLNTLGVELVFHRIEQRPGRPMWFGVSKASKPIFALPGNPVSTLVCLTRYVLPALRQAMGLDAESPETVRLATEVVFSADLVYFLPVKLNSDDTGLAVAEPNPTNTSGDFVSLAGTDGFIELPRGQEVFPQGMATRLFRW